MTETTNQTQMNPQIGYVPTDEMVIDDLDTLKVLADPLRLRIRELMTQPCTVKQVAAELEIPPTKLYYHINLLEKHGLIVLVDTRIVSGIIEKHYQVASRSVRVARHLLSTEASDTQGVDITITGLFDDTRQDLQTSIKAGVLKMDEDVPTHRSLSAGSARFALTEEQAKDLYERLGTLFQEFNELSEAQMENYDHDNHDLQLYKYFLTLFPSSRKLRLQDK